MPLGVSCHTELLELKSDLPSTDSTKRASKNRWHTERAISLAIENVVVVVVVTIRDGSFGSGIRFDCENLSEPRFVIASSDVNVCSTRVNLTRCGVSGSETMSVENRSLKSCALLESASLGLFLLVIDIRMPLGNDSRLENIDAMIPDPIHP